MKGDLSVPRFFPPLNPTHLLPCERGQREGNAMSEDYRKLGRLYPTLVSKLAKDIHEPLAKVKYLPKHKRRKWQPKITDEELARLKLEYERR